MMGTSETSDHASRKHGDGPARLMCRGVRGATTAEVNTAEAIILATREMLEAIVSANQMHPGDVASAYFSTTPDLNATFPAIAARQLGWSDVPLLCGHEMAVPHGLPRCIRVLVHWNTTRSQKEIRHIYIGAAQSLRPDRSDAKLAASVR